MPAKNQSNHQQQIDPVRNKISNGVDQEIDKALAQNEDWEETYGRLFEKKGKKKEKFSGGTLAGQNERMKANKGYARGKGKPKVVVKIKK